MQKPLPIGTGNEAILAEPIVIALKDLEQIAAGAVDSATATCGSGGSRTCGKQIQER